MLSHIEIQPSSHRNNVHRPSTNQDDINLSPIQLPQDDDNLVHNNDDLSRHAGEPSVEAQHATFAGLGQAAAKQVEPDVHKKSDAPASSQPSYEQPKDSNQGTDHRNGNGDVVKDRESVVVGLHSDEHESGYQDSANGESDEQESGYQDSDSGESDNLEDDNLNLELFGLDNTWRMIKEERQKIKEERPNIILSRNRKRTKGESTSLKTSWGDELLHSIKAATQLYDSADQEQADVQHQEVLDSLTNRIDDLSERSCHGEERQVIQLVCTHAVPSMVILLCKAMQARSGQLSDRENITALMEVIRLLKLLVTLCQKACKWKAKPLTKIAIKMPTGKINQLSRIMRNAFSKELKKRKQRLRILAAQANEPTEIDEDRIQLDREAAKRQEGAVRRVIVEDCRHGRATQWGRRPDPQSQLYRSPLRVATQNAVNDWSGEQDRALVAELIRWESRHLTGKTLSRKRILR